LAVGRAAMNNRLSPVPFDTPLYAAGVDEGDTIVTIDGERATMAVWNAIGNRKVGDQVQLGIVRRGGATVTKTITLQQDPTAQQRVTVENPRPAQTAFRDAWLSTRVR